MLRIASDRATCISFFLLPLWLKLNMIWKILSVFHLISCDFVRNGIFPWFKIIIFASCALQWFAYRRKSNYSHSFCNFVTHTLIGSFERKVSTTSREDILAEKNICGFLIFCGYVKHTLPPKCSIRNFFTHRLVTLYSKTSDVKASLLKYEVD